MCARACVRVNHRIVILQPHHQCVCARVCASEEAHLRSKMSRIKKNSSQPLDVLSQRVRSCLKQDETKEETVHDDVLYRF